MFFADSVKLSGARLTSKGFLVADARFARSGLYTYSGREVERPDLTQAIVYRPEDEVFSQDAMASFAHRAICNDHPPESITSENWTRYSKGYTGDSVARDGEFVRVPMMVTDAATIRDVQSGKVELSAGYECQLDWTPGETSTGDRYDAVMRSIKGDHVAIVEAGRAGPSCRIGDRAPAPPVTAKDIPHMAETLRAVMFDGVTIQTTDQGVQAIEKLQSQLTDIRKRGESRDAQLAALQADHAKALEQRDGAATALKATHDAALQAKDGEIAALKAQIPDAAALDALVEAKGRTIAAAKAILGSTYDGKGKTEGEIKRAAVAKRLGDAAVKDKSDDYVGACFDTLTALPSIGARNPLADAIAGASTIVAADAGAAAHAARQEMVNNAWRNPQKGAV